MKKALFYTALFSCLLHTNLHSYISLKGTDVARVRKEQLKEKINNAQLTRAPHLAIIQVQDDDASKSVYIEHKKRACKQMGFDATHILLPAHTTQRELEQRIMQLNEDDAIDGMIVQLPLPIQFDQWKVVDTIAPEKDVDGLTSTNMGTLKRSSQKRITPATAKGILAILKHYGIETRGKECTIVGGSELVGHPLQVLLSREDDGLARGAATITLCHKQTADLKKHTRHADILIVAAGCPELITADMVKEGAIVIDAGISRKGKKLVGDVAFSEVAPKCSAITPVPGGVGPMTVISLLENLFKVARNR